MLNAAYALLTDGMTEEARGVFDAKLGGESKARPALLRPGVVDPSTIAPNNPDALMLMMGQVARTTRSVGA